MDNIGFSFDTSGLNAAFKGLGDTLVHALLGEVFLAGEALRADSVMIVPFDKGFNGGLAGSASTQPAVVDPAGNVEAEVGYNMPYAARLHEDMTLHINQKFAAAGQRRQQKYLEKPAKENAQKYGSMLADGIRSILK